MTFTLQDKLLLMSDLLEDYIACVRITQSTDYADRNSVRRHNRAVDRMYRIVELAEQQGQVNHLATLLDDPVSARWLAHQLVERTTIDEETQDRCFRIVEGLATTEVGEQLWLRQWRSKKAANQLIHRTWSSVPHNYGLISKL